jgi:hypothetical protein
MFGNSEDCPYPKGLVMYVQLSDDPHELQTEIQELLYQDMDAMQNYRCVISVGHGLISRALEVESYRRSLVTFLENYGALTSIRVSISFEQVKPYVWKMFVDQILVS